MICCCSSGLSSHSSTTNRRGTAYLPEQLVVSPVPQTAAIRLLPQKWDVAVPPEYIACNVLDLSVIRVSKRLQLPLGQTVLKVPGSQKVLHNMRCNAFASRCAGVVLRLDIQLLRVQDNQLVDATLVTMIDRHLDDFETLWKARLRVSEEEDRFWDWEMKNRVYLSSTNYEAYAIDYEQVAQGLMLLETSVHRSWYEPHRRIVYVHSLATAPWNRSSIQTPVTYRLVGSTLLEFARFRCEELGYGGLVGLHALSGAEAFYRRMNMSDCGMDEENENLT
jgi:hypothetical protein